MLLTDSTKMDVGMDDTTGFTLLQLMITMKDIRTLVHEQMLIY